jgi:hypothetical protein
MNQGTLTISFDDHTCDSAVEMIFDRMSPRDALYTRDVWLARFAEIHAGLEPRFSYDGPDYQGEWENVS